MTTTENLSTRIIGQKNRYEAAKEKPVAEEQRKSKGSVGLVFAHDSA